MMPKAQQPLWVRIPTHLGMVPTTMFKRAQMKRQEEMYPTQINITAIPFQFPTNQLEALNEFGL